MSGSGKSLIGLWLYRSGEHEWAVREGSPLHKQEDIVNKRDEPVQQQAPQQSKAQSNSDKMPRCDKTSIIFTLNNQVGGLARALQVFQELGINVLHLELQNTSSSVDQAEVFVDIECDPRHLERVVRLLKREVKSVSYASPLVSDDFPPPTPLSACSSFGKLNLLSVHLVNPSWLTFLIAFSTH